MKAKLGALALALIACGPSRPPLPPDACRPAETERPWEGRGYSLEVPWFAPKRGADHPRVVIQEFSDFECPYCARALPQMEQAVEDYGACVQVVWRNYPLPYHPHAELAARASMEIYAQRGDAAFWRYHDRLFADQARLERADLERYAQELGGVDMDAFRRALDAQTYAEVIARDRASIDGTGARIGTPAFMINGTLLVGARPYDQFQVAIEDALRDAYR